MGWRIKKTKQGIVFDSFGRYDVDKAIKKFNPKVQGGQFASTSKVVDASDRTTDENNYLTEINQYIKELMEYGSKKSVEINKEINRVIGGIETENITFSNLYRFFKDKSSTINDAFIHEEESNQERRIDLRNELNNFRLANRITKREAYYPKSYILHFAWIFVFIFIEALINSYFFGEASSLGLLGGVFIGFITSFFNVTLSTISGYILRYKNHISWLKKIFGYLGFLLLFMVIVVLHLFIAHYREILTHNPNIEIWSVLEPLLKHPLLLHDMESLILIALGMLITLFSIFKGLNLDDKYPGYGSVYRRWKEKNDAFLSSKRQARSLMRELYSASLKKSDEMMSELSKSKKSLEDLSSDIDAFINTYTGYHIHAIESARKLLTRYRDGAKFVYGRNTKFSYSDQLLVGKGGLSKLDCTMLDESNIMIDKELKNIYKQIENFYENQRKLEIEIDEMKERYLNDENIEKILYNVKKNREIRL